MDYQKLEHARIALALIGAVITGGAALYGVHAKARQATAATYDTLAPEVNELKAAVTALQAENAELRKALTGRGIAVADPEPRASGAPAQGRSAPRHARPARPRPAEPKGEATPVAGAPPVEAPPAGQTPPASAPTSPPPPAAPPPASPNEPGVLDDVEKRVPKNLEDAVDLWKKMKDLRKGS